MCHRPTPPTRRLAAVLGVSALATLGACGDGGGSDTPDTAPVASAVTSTTVSVTSTSAPATSAAPLATARVALTEVADVAEAIALARRFGDDDAMYVASRDGRIERIPLDGSDPSMLLDLRARVGDYQGEQGLLGIAWNLDGTVLIVSYTDGDDGGASVIERYPFEAGAQSPSADPTELLRVAQPATNHNGGHVEFGPDSMLYIGFGDGGGQGDPGNRAQDLTSLLGKILRIDVAAPTYTIPADNPYVDGPGGARREIWIAGVRNPWRFSFDQATGDLWIADVGANSWEEVNVLRAADGLGRGANLGWDRREGTHPTDEDDGSHPDGGFHEPILDYGHDQGASITGGVVVRDPRLGELDGVYLYSDFAAAKLWGLRVDGDAVVDSGEIDTNDTTMNSVVSFGVGPNDEVYIASLSGTVWRVDPA